MAKLIQFPTVYLADNNSSIDYTPGSDVNAGEVVNIGTQQGFATNDVKAGDVGEFKLDGVFLGRKQDPATLMAMGSKVDYSAGNFIAGTTFEVVETSASGDLQVKIRALAIAGGASGTNRKEGLQSEGDVSGVVSVDFTTGVTDNRHMRVTDNITSLTFTFGIAGKYNIQVEIGATGKTIPKPSNVRGDWLLQTNTLDSTNNVELFFDGSEATVQSISLEEP